jgi:hypothetical protein
VSVPDLLEEEEKKKKKKRGDLVPSHPRVVRQVRPDMCSFFFNARRAGTCAQQRSLINPRRCRASLIAEEEEEEEPTSPVVVLLLLLLLLLLLVVYTPVVVVVGGGGGGGAAAAAATRLQNVNVVAQTEFEYALLIQLQQLSSSSLLLLDCCCWSLLHLLWWTLHQGLWMKKNMREEVCCSPVVECSSTRTWCRCRSRITGSRRSSSSSTSTSTSSHRSKLLAGGREIISRRIEAVEVKLLLLQMMMIRGVLAASS